MNVLEQFLSDSKLVLDWVSLMVRNFIANIYGNLWQAPSLRHILFITAMLPVIFGFAVEIILSFIFSFRLKRFILFRPIRYIRSGTVDSKLYRPLSSSVFPRSYFRSKVHNLDLKPVKYFSFVRPVVAESSLHFNKYALKPAYSGSREPRRFSLSLWLKAKLSNHNNSSTTTTSVTVDNGIVTTRTITRDADGNINTTITRDGSRTTTHVHDSLEKTRTDTTTRDALGNTYTYHGQSHNHE